MPELKPLPYRHRNFFFYLLVAVFVTALPFLFLYASGYRFDWSDVGFTPTGGIYVAADKTGASIYINDELVRETRVFRRAFYAQGLPVGTHKVHVQKEGYHTWVKELPVYSQLVTEALAFNLPIKPEVRVITPKRTESGIALIAATTTVMMRADVTNQHLFLPRAATTTLTVNPEFNDLIVYFEEDAKTNDNRSLVERMRTTLNEDNATSSTEIATTTKEWRGVRLYELEGDVYANYIGGISSMPYYYCAADFPRYQPATTTRAVARLATPALASEFVPEGSLEVQTVTDEDICEPVIKLDDHGETISYFDFFPDSIDLVVLGQESGVYLIEIDDRAWQNRQPLLEAPDLKVRVVNGAIYAYDGEYIYQIAIDQDWF